MHYEMMIHKAWFDYADQVFDKLQSPIIRKDFDTKKLFANLDPYVMQVVNEVEMMLKLKLAVPEATKMLLRYKESIIRDYETTTVLVTRNNDLRESIPSNLIGLMRPQLVKLEKAFAAAQTQVCWTSANIEDQLEKVKLTLDEFEQFLSVVVDIDSTRIEKNFTEIGNAEMLVLPDDGVSPDEFLEMNRVHRREIGKILNSANIYKY